MKDDEKTKRQLVIELTDLRSQSVALEKSITRIISAELAAEESRRYAESVVETVREPFLILDADLKIVSANHNFYATFKVAPGETIGNLIYNLGNRQWNIPKLLELLEDILPKKEIFNDFEVEHTFQNIGHKIMLLNARQIYREDINSRLILLAIEDITERRLIEEKVLLAAIADSAKDAIIGKSLDGIIISWNRGAEEIYGYTKSEIIGKSISVLVPPEVPDELTNILRKIKLGERIETYETVRQRKDGQNIYVSLKISAIHDAEGTIVGASTIARDITERKQMEKLLSDSEEQYRLLFETANDGILLIEKNEGKIVHINPSVEKMLGYSARESIGNKLQDVGLIIDNGDFQITMKNLNDRGILRYRDVPVKTKSGQDIYTDTYLVDKAKFAQCNIRDITERKQAEEKMHEITERLHLVTASARAGVWDWNLQTNEMIWDDRMLELYGLTRENFHGGVESWEQGLHPDDSSRAVEECQAALRGEQDFDTDFRVRHPNGTVIHIKANGLVLRDENGKPLRMIGLNTDITDRERLAAELRESERRFMDVLYSSPDAILLIDGEQFVDCNEATARMLGYTNRNEFLKTHPSELSPPMQPDGQSSFEKANEMMGAAFEKGFHQFEWVHRRANGEDFPVELSLTPIVLHGKNVIHCMWRELTERKRAEEELQRTLQSLRKAVGTTIHALVSAVEVRDPYTSGHQVRSADLARAIAVEMGLSPERIEGIRMAGSIHDIGKLAIPSEILSKPTKLTNIEFSLIKEHSRKGYEMLKDVESMASHRPYRPSLGIDAALEEIANNRGTFYDEAVADACLRLFREKGFKLEMT